MTRCLIIGAGDVGIRLAKLLLERGFKVTIMDIDEKAMDRVLKDVGFEAEFVHGNAEVPADLKKADVSKAEVVIAATNNDRANVIAGLIAKKLGAKDVVVRLKNPTLHAACQRLGIRKILDMSRLAIIAIDSLLKDADVLQVIDEISGTIKLEAITIDDKLNEVTLENNRIPGTNIMVIAVKKHDKWRLADPNFKLKKGDTVIAVSEAGIGILKNIKEIIRRSGLKPRKTT
ncbi:MAG: potassium channel family protein [Candidatus Nezhaarchaeales archaeon]